MSNVIKVALIVLAFTFSGNIEASTATTGSWFSKIVSIIKAKKANYGNSKYCKPTPPKCKPGQKMPRKGRKGCPKVPIDGGLGVLVLGAAAFGARKLREKK